MTWSLAAWQRAAMPCVALLVVACSGGGGSGNDSPGSDEWSITGAGYGRQIEENGETRLVSPYTTVESDPITGAILPGTLAPLVPGLDIEALVTLGLGGTYVPRVIPRNAVLVLTLPSAVDPSSLVADVLDDEGNVLSPGTVQLRTQDGKGVPVALSAIGNQVWVSPLVPGRIGFPASPVAFGPDGEPRADATGFLRLIAPTATQPIDPANPPRVLRAKGGAYLSARALRPARLGRAPDGKPIRPGPTAVRASPRLRSRARR